MCMYGWMDLWFLCKGKSGFNGMWTRGFGGGQQCGGGGLRLQLQLKIKIGTD